jgi:hypothetical protein
MEANMKMLDEGQGDLPLLVGFSVQRTGDDTLPGHYDAEQQVWVVENGYGVKPIIEAAGDLCELATKTFAAPERDDVESMVLLEATTKTEARPERDDVPRPSMMVLLDMVTKTKAQQERDD